MGIYGTRAGALVAIALLPVGLAAQQPAVRIPATLTLEEAIRIARENNPDYQKLQNDLSVASSQVRTRWAAFLPNLNASLGSSLSAATTYTAFDDFGRPVAEPRAVTTETSSASQGLSLGFTLFDGQMFPQLTGAKYAERRVEATVHNQSVAIEATVKRSYFEARQREMQAEVERRNLAARRDRLERTEQSFRLAASTQVDLLGAQQEVITAERQLADAESEARKALMQLQQTLGVEGSIEFELAGDLPEVFDPATLDVARLVEQAKASNPSILQNEASYEEARRGVSASRASRWPRITGSAGYNRGASEQGFGGFGNLNPRNNSRNLSLSVSLPLFSRFQTSHTIAQAEATADDAREDLRRARLQIERETRAAIVDLEKAFRGLRAAEEIARIAALRLELAEERYRTGAQDMGFIQLQQVADANANAQRATVDARFQFLTARVALEEKLGAPLNR
jgi:outer membrane protein